jgi:hypothetical protein
MSNNLSYHNEILQSVENFVTQMKQKFPVVFEENFEIKITETGNVSADVHLAFLPPREPGKRAG